MEYIRTKDNIYELKEPYYVDKANHLCWRFSLLPLAIHDMGEIIKQADTIEELCDEFVAVPHNLEKPMLGRIEVPTSGGDYPMFLNQKTNWYHDLYSFVGVYGAIWTDKGLQFVARMNSKGKLELL